MITVYAVAGVPADCGGLTRENCTASRHTTRLPSDSFREPWRRSKYSPLRVSNSQVRSWTLWSLWRAGCLLRSSQGRLRLSRYLDVHLPTILPEKSPLTQTSFTYTLNIILSILRILSFHYIHKSEVAKLCEQAELKGKGSYSDLASLITRVSSHHVPTPHPTPPSSPAPSFHSSPITHNLHTQIPAFYSPPTSPHPRPQTSPSNSSPISPRPHTHSQLSPLPSSPTPTNSTT